MTKMRASVSTTMTTPMAEKVTAADLPAVRLTAAMMRAIAPAITSRTTKIVRTVERREDSGLGRPAGPAMNRKTTAKISWNIGNLCGLQRNRFRPGGRPGLDHMRLRSSCSKFGWRNFARCRSLRDDHLIPHADRLLATRSHSIPPDGGDSYHAAAGSTVRRGGARA